MVPDEDATIALAYRPRPSAGPRLAIQPRHLDELAFAVEAPTMERTGDSVTAHPTTDAQVGSQVGAVGIKDPCDPVLTSEEHEILPEVGHRPHVARCQVGTSTDTEPTVGGGQGTGSGSPWR